MSFYTSETGAKVYAPGFFLASADCKRETKEIPQSGATTAPNGGKYVKAGTPFPSNDANAVGFLYEDVDVTSGDMPGSVVTSGEVYLDRLPVTLASAAKTALAATGFKFYETAPAVTRPNWTNG
jgi:hypothetical protein